MRFAYASVIDGPVEEVFGWHTRPGALTRLLPPWLPVRVVEETTSLRDGRSVLAWPAGLRWIAQHDPDGFDPPNQFVDRLASFPRRVVPFEHRHEFRPESVERTQMVDVVTTPVPASRLRPMLAYRHRQLADDLATQRWGAALSDRPVTVAVTGSSGLIGTALVSFLSTAGHRVIRLVRHPPLRPDERHWDPQRPAADLLTGVDVVVHLAGASIAGRFTESHRQALRDSRIPPTRRLAEVAAAGGVSALVVASAIGYYGADRARRC